MSTKKIDYKAVLADLIAQRDKINKAIAGIQAMTGIELDSLKTTDNSAQPSFAEISANDIPADAIPGDAFFKMTTVDAARKYLEIKKSPQTAKEISNALTIGGIITQSSNFINNVNAILKRAEHKTGAFVRVKRKWGLGDWYKKKSK